MNKILPIILVVVLFFPELSFGRVGPCGPTGTGSCWFTDLITFIFFIGLFIFAAGAVLAGLSKAEIPWWIAVPIVFFGSIWVLGKFI